MIDKLFDQLDDWRKLPNYQLERRADIFFAIHLPILFKNLFSLEVLDIIPEFPIRIGTIYPLVPINKSFKADYIVYTNNLKAFLVELKTDNGSIRVDQVKYYYKSIESGYYSLLTGLLDIYKASSYKEKYLSLLLKLVNNGSLEKTENSFTPIDKYSFYQIPIFIKPTLNDGDIGYILTYEKIREILKNEQNQVTQRFIKSLYEWITPV
jgi:hypothetical protein